MVCSALIGRKIKMYTEKIEIKNFTCFPQLEMFINENTE